MASSNVLISSNYELSVRNVREYQSISQSLGLHVMPDVMGTDTVTDEAVSLSFETEKPILAVDVIFEMYNAMIVQDSERKKVITVKEYVSAIVKDVKIQYVTLVYGVAILTAHCNAHGRLLGREHYITARQTRTTLNIIYDGCK